MYAIRSYYVNEGDEKIEVQMGASEWTQDAEGKDRYTETNDLVFFPKIMTIESKEERILRAGKGAALVDTP